MSDEVRKSSITEKILPIFLVATILLAFAVGALWQKLSNLEKNTKEATTQQDTQPKQVAVSMDQIKALFGKDLIKFGDDKSKLLFVEVSDPSCPYCHIAGGLNKALIKQFDKDGTYKPPVPEMKKLVDAGKASFVYIYTPGHGSGEMGMKALYCAYDQDKFWEAHDLLMNDAGYTLLNDTVKNDIAQAQKLVDYLKNVVDVDKLKECLDSGKYDARLTSDTELASSLGVTGTPGFFVNTTNFAGAYSYTQMQPVVEAALK